MADLSFEDSMIVAAGFLAAAREVGQSRHALPEERARLLAHARELRTNARWYAEHARRV